ncbi:M1 family metallopeptidase [Mucilaginibacter gossypii]|uniref:M1 family metallopeptidase n=1 Tax=Mucilaginibacter gossypii TaxID=551996 RepID=UPI000DCB9C02|nr:MULTISPECIES: M1 family metallopeptidase [Mucilaginibacter]QTE38119.1 M1 family metallopeptidase [Mucilaginibacter gossypii]RAV58567.1 M1 family peptidase [Mucilaginibacter rubeus]
MKKFSFILIILLASVSLYAQTLTSGGKLKPEQAIMDVRHYTISLAVDPEQKTINGFTTIDVIMTKPTKVLLFDLLDSLSVSKVLVNGKQEPFEYKNNLITINTAKELPAGKASVKVIYGGKPHVARRPPWDDGFIWTRDSTGHQWMAITAEGTGGKLYFPCKDHPSDEPNEGVDMFITVPKDLVVAGPGLLKGVSKQKGTATFHWQTKYTINNYSILFNAGDYTVVTRPYTTVDGHNVPIQFYVLKEHASKAEDHLDIFVKTIKEQEKYFGEYPWVKEKIGIVETPHLGMEHQTMNAYGAKFKYTKVGGEDYDGLMHHEFGHEWWGNKVTAKDWADYWIHEGICTYGDALYVREFEGEKAYIKFFQNSALSFGNKIPIVIGKDIDEESAYNGDIYGKGAFFMHTLRYIMGDSIFFPTLKGFVTDPRYTYSNLASTDDVIQYFSKAAGQDLKPLFDLYIYSINKLEIHIKAQRGDKYQVQLLNIDMPLPVDITTDGVTKRYTLDKKGITVTSKTMPVIDPNTYYLKKLIIE